MKTYDTIRKITAGQGYVYASGCLQNHNYFKKHYSLIAIDLSKQQVLDTGPKAIQQINLTKNLSGVNNRIIFFIIEEAKETVSDFSKGTVKVL